MNRGSWWATVHGVTRVGHKLVTKPPHTHTHESDTNHHTHTHTHTHTHRGFPGGSDSKESACNGGDPGSIPGSGRSPGEGNGYLLQYSCLENSMY